MKLGTEILLPFPKLAYRMLKGKEVTCPKCGGKKLLWLNSPEAKRLMRENPRPWWKF